MTIANKNYFILYKNARAAKADTLGSEDELAAAAAAKADATACTDGCGARMNGRPAPFGAFAGPDGKPCRGAKLEFDIKKAQEDGDIDAELYARLRKFSHQLRAAARNDRGECGHGHDHGHGHHHGYGCGHGPMGGFDPRFAGKPGMPGFGGPCGPMPGMPGMRPGYGMPGYGWHGMQHPECRPMPFGGPCGGAPVKKMPFKPMPGFGPQFAGKPGAGMPGCGFKPGMPGAPMSAPEAYAKARAAQNGAGCGNGPKGPKGGMNDGFMGRGRVLVTLSMQDGMTQKDLAFILGIRPQSLGELLTKLEADGYITRTKSEADRRATVVTLTDAGREKAAHIQEKRNASVDTIFAKLTAEEKTQLCALLAKLED